MHSAHKAINDGDGTESLLLGTGTRNPPTPPIVFFYVILVALGGSLFGFEISNVSGAKLFFAKEFDMDQKSFYFGVVTSSITIGAIVGTAVAGVFQNLIGRRFSVIAATVVYIGGVVVEYLSHSANMLLGGRIVVGLAIGIFSSTVPMYIAELSPPQLRGMLVTGNQFCICLGILFGYVAGWGLRPQWRVILSVGAPVALVLMICFALVTPFSPRWLVSRGRQAEALQVLEKLRGDPTIAAAETQEIADSLEESRLSGSAWQRLREPHVSRTLLVGIGLSMFQQITGVNSINFYAPDILEDAGFKASQSFVMSIMIGVSKVIFVGVALASLDKVGRKVLLIGGTTFMGILLAVLGALLQVYEDKPKPKAVSIASATSLFLFMGGFEISFGPVVWLILGEVFPLDVRSEAMGISATFNWCVTLLVGSTFPLLVKVIGISVTFYIFAGMCVLAIVFVVVFLPETRGTTLEEIEDLFRASVGDEDAKARVRAKQAVQDAGGSGMGLSLAPVDVHLHDDSQDDLLGMRSVYD